MKNVKNRKKSILIILGISIVAVILIPMLYSSIYLSAFWDTYGKIDNVPVAFVNLDKQVTKDGKDYNIGKDVEDKLKDNDKVKWNFVSYDDAKKGVEGKDYYAMIVIPSDFSEKLANAKDGKFDKPEVIYEGNKGKNYVFYQISEKVAQSIKSDITSNIQEETSKSLVDNLYDIKSSLSEASDGATKLQDGTQKLVDGSDTLKSGMFSALSGSKLLEDGLKQAAQGEKSVSNGADSLIAGLNQLKSGLSQKNDNIGKLVDGASGVSNWTKMLLDKSTSIYNDVSAEAVSQKALSDKLVTKSKDIDEVSLKISSAEKKISDIVENYEKNAKFSETDIADLKDAKSELTEAKNKKIDITAEKDSAATSSTNLGNLKDKAQLAAKIASNTSNGAQSVSGGVNQLVSTLNESLNNAVEGTDKLINGTQDLKNGSEKLYTGLDNASNKTGDLSNGLSKLKNGSIDLNSGLNTANDGTTKLKDGLNEGYNKMTDKLKFTSDDMSKFISEPVSLNEETLNDVPKYGEGLAPYFVSLSLWLGGMFINLVLSIAKGLKVIDNKFAKSFFGKFCIGAIIAIIQALLVSLVLVHGLNIDTIGNGYLYFNNILISLSFFSIMYGVSYAIGIVGTPIMFIVFLLQLASAGGTFPIETAPAFFRIISEYLPFTYSVGILRMVIGGMNLSIYQSDVTALLIFAGSFLIGGYIIRALINSIKQTKVQGAEKVLEVA